MATVTDNSANFPQVFETCGACGRRGVYMTKLQHLGGGEFAGPLVRCKFCKRGKDLTGVEPLPLAMEASLIGVR